MSGFFSRLFGHGPCHDGTTDEPDEQAMKLLLDDAKKKNRLAAEALDGVADRQQRDAELVRQVISDILDRADHKKSRQAGKVIG